MEQTVRYDVEYQEPEGLGWRKRIDGILMEETARHIKEDREVVDPERKWRIVKVVTTYEVVE